MRIFDVNQRADAEQIPPDDNEGFWGVAKAFTSK